MSGFLRHIIGKSLWDIANAVFFSRKWFREFSMNLRTYQIFTSNIAIFFHSTFDLAIYFASKTTKSCVRLINRDEFGFSISLAWVCYSFKLVHNAVAMVGAKEIPDHLFLLFPSCRRTASTFLCWELEKRNAWTVCLKLNRFFIFNLIFISTFFDIFFAFFSHRAPFVYSFVNWM